MSAAYYAKGMEIWKSPVATENGDGTTSISIGFQCATATEIVGEEGANAIAEMLTLTADSADLTAEASARIAAVSEENERMRKERDEMADWIKSATTTISDAIGGGSEMFIRRGEAYRIDPRFVANYIETRRGDLHEARVAIVKLRKEAAQ